MDLYNNDTDHYPHFIASIKESFNLAVGSGSPLFTTDAENLFDIFLNGLPAEARQHYTCNACRSFVNRYGSLVRISVSGEAIPVMWDENATPEFFRNSVAEVKRAVLKSRVTGVFLSESNVLGQPVTGEWEHMSAMLPQQMVFQARRKTASEEMAEKLQEYLMLNTALQDYPMNVVDRALALINSETLYRGDKVKGVAEWFKALMVKMEEAVSSKQQKNLKWLAVATAPAGFTHIRSGMLGTLLNDIKDGKSVEAIARNFHEKMDSLKYMRPQAPPSQGNIQRAEEVVARLGIAESLRRRYAKFEEIPVLLWQERTARKAEEKKASGVFSHLTPKGASKPESEMMTLPSAEMTWVKFQRDVMPTAEVIEAQVDSPSKFMALVTAADPSAPNILRWGNPVSWYYRRGASYDAWGMSAGKFAKVRGITESPNQWGEEKVAHSGHQIFFILEGCRDLSGRPGGGFFPEMLKSELHEVRSTLEAHSNAAPIEDAESASACGVGYSKDNTSGLTLRVTSGGSIRLITIDRWD